MGVGSERKIIKVVRQALAQGPMSQEALLAALHNAGVRTDSSDLYITCATHGLADLHGDSWVPRGWAAPMADAKAPPPVQRPPEPPAARRAAVEVRQLATSIGISMDEPTPPAGPVPAAWPGIAEQAARALHDELRAVTDRRTLQDVQLNGGFVVAETTSRKLMRFEAEGDLGVSEGAQATLVVDGVPIDVEVVSVFGNVVTLSVPPAATVPAEATLRCDLSWLLSAQSRRLRELTNGGPGFNAEAAAALLSVGRDVAPQELPAVSAEGLNHGQRYAVQLALTPGVTWLWGPPGTGKTTTIGALVAQLCVSGLRVLLTAPTNAAVDVAVQAVLKEIPELAGGALVRLGQPSDTSLIGRSDGLVLIDEIAAKRGEVLAEMRVREGQRVRSLRERLRPLERRHADLTDEEQQLRLTLERDLADSTALVRELDESLQFVRRQVCREAEVVAATSHQVVLRTLRELTFDVVILDEASMTTTALAMLVAGAGSGHTIVAGDFRQLPPVVVADTPSAKEWLLRSPFEKAGVDVAVGSGMPPIRLAALTQQYRMRGDINHVVSEAFYPESPLVTASTVSTRAHGSRAPWADGELVLLDTSLLGARTARKQGMSSRYNLMHAQLVAGFLGDSDAEVSSLGVISPFAAQARLLESLLPESALEDWAASTVHRFQGGERDIVIYDTVDTGTGVRPLHRWFTEGEKSGDGARLLNVAASRARDHLVVVAALDQLHRHRTARDAVWRFFTELHERGRIVSWEEALKHAPVTRRASGDVSRLLRDDLAGARSVEMWLPRAPLVGLRSLLPSLKLIAEQDVETEPVTIWVEPDPDGYLSAEATEAKRGGVNIRPCVPILESSAVIDDVVWTSTGSLLGPNPGVVLRTQHGAFADAVRRAQRRRPGIAPGSGQLGDDCGRCFRTLARFEVGRRGLPTVGYGCPVCDSARKRTSRDAPDRQVTN
ncbi:Exodeoxyribonuclease V [Micromonospora saelicesensis]|uniref:DEAD/DEAH box helicase n=1 Tax=Micromonospora saelicesensis TaxID=285676 RepID=UPI000DBF6C91|nr:AAA domain-containing protein [Micromonospora saelicesensis]RAO51529.1 Exodeoxyribonuclease V [Micromonospora saelicesensis]